MGVYLIDTPIKDYGNNPQSSRWVAAWHPCIFSFQRADFAITSIGDNPLSSGQIVINIAGDITAELNVGNNIYVNCPVVSIDGTIEVFTFSYDAGTGLTSIIVANPTIGAIGSQSGLVNLVDTRINYQLSILVTYYESGLPVIENSFAEFTPNPQGIIKCDIQQWIQPMISADDMYYGYNFQSIASYLGRPFVIQWRIDYQELATGNAISGTFNAVDVQNKYNVTNAVRKVGNTYGNNQAQLLMYGFGNSFGPFLTKFEQPTYYPGYPFDFTFLYDLNIDENAQIVWRSDEQLDVNGNTISIIYQQLNDNTDFANRIGMTLDYDPLAESVNVSLIAKDSSGTTIGTISETKNVIINRTCQQNAIYLKWLNPIGGFDYFMFNWNNVESDTTSNELGFQKYIPDLSQALGRYDVLSVDNQSQIELGAENLSRSQREGLRYLLRSPKVQMYIGTDEYVSQYNWVNVTVVRDTFQIDEAQETKGGIDFIILPPQDYNQQQ